jgi:quaternary ammonium compound-resistance protein SugE
MPWIFLIIAGIFELGWPLGFKLSQTSGQKFFWIFMAVISMTLSGIFLWLAQRDIPIGTAYAVWTGIGAMGTLLIGMVFFHDGTGFWRLFFASFIVIGIIGLKIHSRA